LIFCETVPLLNLAFELFATAIYNVEIVVSKLSPLLLDLAFDLLPVSFDSIPVNLRRSVHCMTNRKHMAFGYGSIMRPCAGFVLEDCASYVRNGTVWFRHY
jgi:hypothetical protein